MAHDPPVSGHLGVNKTRNRVLASFYWPGVFADIANYCKTCDTCQKTATIRPTPKAPLKPIPSIGRPFQKIGMDILGPLEMSKGRKRYILVLVDYATRFPIAIPLTNIRSTTIADELMTTFCNVGLPDQIISDNASDFASQLMKQACRILGIEQCFASCYHPESLGLIERFVGTMKAMLKTLDDKQWKEWDKFVPYFCFAYREVPQASTGFTPFELLYAHPVRGPLDVLKSKWTTESQEDTGIIDYVLDMRDKMEKMLTIAQNNIENAQSKQKAWYDQNAREREFTEGQMVLILLPADESKVRAKWQGPYTITKKIDDLSYEVLVRRKKKKLHVNLLAPYHERSVAVNMVTSYDSPSKDEEADWTEEDEIEDDPIQMVDLATCQTQTIRDVTFSQDLDSRQRNQMENILEEYRDRFTDIPGQTDRIYHDVIPTSGQTVRQKAYPVPYAKKASVKEELDTMMKMGVIEHSRSPYASPMVRVPKKNGELRLCGDFRKINSISEVDPYPMPSVEQITDEVAQGKYISTLDLTRGYYQVPLTTRAKEMSAFITPFGLFQYCVMPFGMVNSGATFQRLIDDVLEGCENFARGYIDDLVIFSNTWEDHKIHVREVLRRLTEAGLTVKPNKCTFGASTVQYLGHVVGSGGVAPNKDKVKEVLNFPRPTTKRDIRAFLGLSGYYSKFIQNYATIAKPLTDMTRKNLPNIVVWTGQAEQAFLTLKKRLTNAPILRAPDFERTFIVQTDASDYGLGAVLTQLDKDEHEHPIRYLSRKMTPAESRYSVTEKECLAIVWALKKLYPYLYGVKFVLQTDHKALKWLQTARLTNSRVSRWSLALQPYKFDIQYKQGTTNANADSLSRI